MDAVVRRTLDMADRVRGFNLAHPSDDATIASVVARLEERITRANALAMQQRGGQLDQLTSTRVGGPSDNPFTAGSCVSSHGPARRPRKASRSSPSGSSCRAFA